MARTGRSRQAVRRAAGLALSAALIGTGLVALAAPAAARPSVTKPTVVYRNLKLVNGDTATVFSNGLAEVFRPGAAAAEYRMIPSGVLPAAPRVAFDLAKAPAVPYAHDQVDVVLANDVDATSAQRELPATAVAPGAPTPDYTTDATLNKRLAGMGVTAMNQVFDGMPAGGTGVDLSRVYTLHVTHASIPAALAALTASPAVAYAEPDWITSPLNTTPVPMPNHVAAAPTTNPALPTNVGLRTSAQSLLNSTATDWVPAYQGLESAYHQLPGTGEVITDVSLGDLTSAGMPDDDPCAPFVAAFGPTTVVQGGQRFLDLPSMPLIPTWTANGRAKLDPTGETCDVDPFDTEIDLDFAMMAPLPHDQQRPDALGSGLTDLLGIAPGAAYRLVVPSDTTGSISSVDAALLAAARQTPRPDVITASLGFGLDAQGFPSRYLEDDPVTEALIAQLTHRFGITVAVSANDGLRTPTDAAVGTAGGAAATDVAASARQATSLDDVEFSSVPSLDVDSGAIDVGGVTLDDIASAPPQDPANAALADQQAFPEVRWNGAADFSSGFGSRVNLSAPGDNVLGFQHTAGGPATAVDVVNTGGTSASAQEVGAAAAVVLQAARLTGDRSVTSPLALRSYLARTARPVPGVPQADRPLNVGPQVDIGAAVTGLLARAGVAPGPGVARVAVAQRQNVNGFGAFFSTETDPADIPLRGAAQNDWLTIAPDWIGLPEDATYRLAARGPDGERTLATGPSARLRPDAIIAAAGPRPSGNQPTSVTLDYTASTGDHVLANAAVPLTFGPRSGVPTPLAPLVPAVVTGGSFPVHYDLTGQTAFTDPTLVVSAPGRMDPFQHFYLPIYSVPLHGTTGTVRVPVSALAGGGIYGVAVQSAPDQFDFSQFAFTRMQGAPTDVQATAPLLAAAGQPTGHTLTIPFDGDFRVGWDVRQVPHATGVLLEISAAGPNQFNSFATFNNPDGTIRDANGHDTGSVLARRLGGASGSVDLPADVLDPTMTHDVRVIPLLASGTPAGEASQLSTVSRNGVAPSDGGSVLEGFGVDAHGSDGLVTSNQVTDHGTQLSSVQTFDQRDNTITGTLVKSQKDEFSTANTSAPGILAGDMALYADTRDKDGTTTYTVRSPITSHRTSAWTPDVPAGAQVELADNQDTATDAVLIGNAQLGFRVRSTNVAANTFGPSVDLGPELSSFGFPIVTALGEDTATGTAVLGASDFLDGTSPPTLITVDLATGEPHSSTGVGTGTPSGVAVDSATGTAAMATSDGVGRYDLAAGTAALSSPGGLTYQHPAADPLTGDFVVQEVVSPEAELTTPGLGATPDDNALSTVVVLNHQGDVVRRIARFNDFNVFTQDSGDYVQLNPSTRTGYTLGPLGRQLAPFTY
ncbi:MAG TPA: hypothetical protein VHV49_16345 [Pseudonocardiaceae bacterium]|nr:hypothetical protein [Pseudonocardiaceae bacterium]